MKISESPSIRLLKSELEKARAQRDALLFALEIIQWGATDGFDETCPHCGQTPKEQHNPECPVGVAIKAAKP